MIVQGGSQVSVDMHIHEGKAALVDATHLQGQEVTVVEDCIRNEQNNPKLSIIQCGPAGERFGVFSAIIRGANRAKGKTGMGAVMGIRIFVL